MSTQCTPGQLEFHAFGRREVVGRFDGGRLTSDGGGILLREVDRRLGLMERIAGCFTDHRHPGKVEHSVSELVAQRVHGIALGYEDLNDHDALRADSLLALLVGKTDPSGAGRARKRDRGCPLAGSSTLNRLELGRPEDAAVDRYHRIAANADALDRVLVDIFLESHVEAPEELWLDLDATDDPLHGDQEGRFFHGYYKNYCYLPAFMADFNRRLAVAPRNPEDAHRAVLHDAAELDLILCEQHGRKLTKNLTIRFECREYQVTGRGKGYRLRGAAVTVCKAFDGSVTVLRDGRELPVRLLAEGEEAVPVEDEKTVRRRVDRAKAEQRSRPAYKPAPDHPWRRPFQPEAAGTATG